MSPTAAVEGPTFEGPALDAVGGIGALTLGGFLGEVVDRFGPNPAIVFDDPLLGGRTVRWSYEDLGREARRIGRALVAALRPAHALALANAALLAPGVTPLHTSWLQLVRAEALAALRRFPEAQSAYRAVRLGPPAEWARDRLR